MEAVKREIELYEDENGQCPYEEWMAKLKDLSAKGRIRIRIDHVEEGNFGVHKPVGDGVFELIFDFGPGYRVYYGIVGTKVVLLLCGGDKKTQKKDIKKAKSYWENHKENNG